MQLIRRFCILLTLLALALPLRAEAQSSGTVASPNDSIFKRARKLVAEGNGAVGRTMVDSILRSMEEGTSAYGDALYWRGALAETAADAERDYRRVIVEYPLSAYIDDALLAIAELEQARGDRAAALQHLQRFVREHPVSSQARGVAAFAAARLAFEQRDNRVACGLIADARASTLSTNVEMQNQIEYYASRCPAAGMEVASSPPPTIPSTTTPTGNAPKMSTPTPLRDSVLMAPKPTTPSPVLQAPVVTSKATPPVTPKTTTTKTSAKPTGTAKAEETKFPVKAEEAPPVAVMPPRVAVEPPKPAPVKPRGIYTIQVAAFNTQVEAERLVAKLAKSDVKARVSNTVKPFRVRLQFYETRAAAAVEVSSLKSRGIIGFVTTEEPEKKSP